MIFRVIIDNILSLLGRFLVLPTELEGVIVESISWFMWGNHYLPLNTFITCASIILSFWIGCVVIRVVLEVV